MAAPLLLLIDDAPDVAFIVRRLGKHAGQEVVVCTDGPTAWDYLRAPPPRCPDLVLLDLHLPGLTGLDLCRRLRATPELADLPIALFAQPDRSEDVAAGLAAGMDFVLSKELLSRPADWPGRIHELLTFAHSRIAPVLLSYPSIPVLGPAPRGVIQVLNQVLRQATLRQLGPQVLQILADRAVVMVQRWQTATTTARRPAPLGSAASRHDETASDWLLPSGLGLNEDRIAWACGPEALILFAVALTEQVPCVLESAAVAPLRAALAEAFPGYADLHTIQ